MSGQDSENKNLNYLALKGRKYLHYPLEGTQNWVFNRQDVNTSFKESVENSEAGHVERVGGSDPGAAKAQRGDGKRGHMLLCSAKGGSFLSLVNTGLRMKNK